MVAPYWTIFFAEARDDGAGASGRKDLGTRDTNRRTVLPEPSAIGLALDPSLAERIRASDVAAFHELFTACWRPLVGYAMRCAAAYEAADIVQDVFVQLWARRASLDVHGSLRGYLYGAVRQRAGHVRAHEQVVQRAREKFVDGETPGMGVIAVPGDDVLAGEEDRAALRAAIQALPPRGREITILRWYDGLSYKEIAATLGISEATVNVHLTRAMNALRTALRGVL